jgi:Tfp pilus assembly protein PilX
MPNANNRNISQRRTDRGAILMVVLIAMIALIGLGMTGLFLTSGSIQMNANINLRNQALTVAEAGIERARGVLNHPDWTPPMPALLNGSYNHQLPDEN